MYLFTVFVEFILSLNQINNHLQRKNRIFYKNVEIFPINAAALLCIKRIKLSIYYCYFSAYKAEALSGSDWLWEPSVIRL